jgi:hypothetical protein
MGMPHFKDEMAGERRAAGWNIALVFSFVPLLSVSAPQLLQVADSDSFWHHFPIAKHERTS